MIYMRFLIIFLFFVFTPSCLLSVAVLPSMQFEPLTVNQGLPDNSIKCIFDDRDGFFWFGTKNGLARYDGTRFLSFRIVPNDSTSIPDDFVYCITQLYDGRIAVGGANGSVSFLSPDFKFDRTASVSLSRLGIKSAITDIVQSRDSLIWIASQSDGLFVFNPFDLSLQPVLLASSGLNSLVHHLSDLQIVGDFLYVASEASFLSLINLKTRVTSEVVLTKEEISVQSFGTKLFSSSDSVLWVSTERNGFYYLSVRDLSVHKYHSSLNTESSSIVSDIAIVNDSILLVSYDGDGITAEVLFSGKSQKIVPDSKMRNSLPASAIWCMRVSAAGDLCLGTYAQGACFARLQRSPVSHFARNTDLGSVLTNNSILSIVNLDSVHCLISTDGGGLYTLNTSSQTVLPFCSGKDKLNVVKTLFPYRGGFFCGTYGNGLITKFNRASPIQAKLIDSISSESVWSICEDSLGDLWCGTLYNGIYRTEGNFISHYSSDSGKVSIPSNMVNVLNRDLYGIVWAGTEGAGPRFFHNNMFVKPLGWHSYKNVVYSICNLQDSSIAVAYKNYGVDVFKRTKDGYSAIHLSLLGNQSVKSLLYDSIWGLFCVTDRDIYLLNDSFLVKKRWNSSNGIISSGFNTSSIAINNGYLLVGSVSGLSMISLDADLQLNSSCKIRVSAISFYRDNKFVVIHPNSWLFSFNDTISLKYSDVNIKFDIARLGSALSFDRVVYRISGLVDDWVDVPDDFHVALPFIKGGDFVLELAVESESGFNVVSKLYLTIQKPYWEERWFVAGCIFLLIFILFFIYVYRDYSHRKLELMLQHKVDERTLYIVQQNRRLEDNSKLLVAKNQLLHDQKIVLEEQKVLLDETHAKINERNDILEVQQEELERVNLELILQQKEIEHQAEILRDKNKLLTKSLNYAKRIQDSLFPTDAFLKTHLPDSFVFFKPKEIVSGDFFWMKEVDGKIIVAEVDCTGHGVPGAFMSMIGNAFLNEIVLNRRVLDPAEIFYCLNQELVRIFGLGDFDAEAQDDGMDLSLLVIDRELQTVKMSCAMQSIFVLYPDDVVVYSGDIFSIGGLMARFKSPVYTVHTLKLRPGMKIIMASDGYVDQFGGSKKEKYGSDRFIHLFEQLKQQTCPEILNQLEADFELWLQDRSQLDDVLVVGFEF